jgi:FdhE protein
VRGSNGEVDGRPHQGYCIQEIEGGNGNVKAETCGSRHTYVKVPYQQKDAALEPVADDAASLSPDLLARDLGFNRGGVNPYLLGY